MLAGLAAMRLAKRPIVHEHADAAIRFFGNLPGSLGTFERVAELGGGSCGSEEPNSEAERKRDRGRERFQIHVSLLPSVTPSLRPSSVIGQTMSPIGNRAARCCL